MKNTLKILLFFLYFMLTLNFNLYIIIIKILSFITLI